MSRRPRGRTPSYCGQNSDCVGLADLGNAAIGVRNGNLGATSPVLTFTRSELGAFPSGARVGEFDDLA